jgi:dTMP kinase
MQGLLIAFEGLDQSGKETQAKRLGASLEAAGRVVRILSFPDYETPIGAEIGRALHGDRDYPPDVMQLLYMANRYEHKQRIEGWLANGDVVLCDRYVSSSVAYGETQGLDPGWVADVQRYLPQPALTLLLDIAPETAVNRKAAGRDRFERDLSLLTRVRESYRRQASQPGWARVDGERTKDEITADIARIVAERLAVRA